MVHYKKVTTPEGMHIVKDSMQSDISVTASGSLFQTCTGHALEWHQLHDMQWCEKTRVGSSVNTIH